MRYEEYVIFVELIAIIRSSAGREYVEESMHVTEDLLHSWTNLKDSLLLHPHASLYVYFYNLIGVRDRIPLQCRS